MSAPQRPDPFEHGIPVLDGVAPGDGRPRVRLRPPRLPETDGGADLDALWTLFTDGEALRYWSHEPFTTRDQARDLLDRIARGNVARSSVEWAVVAAETDQLVGTVTLFRWQPEHRRAELGYMLRRDLWGRGIATEAVRAVLAFAFGPMGLHRIEADVDPDNAASLRLLARLGFREEGRLAERWFTFGEWRDSVVLGLLAPSAREPADQARGAEA